MRAQIWLLLDSSGLGGIETHVLELATALSDDGTAVEVVFLQDHGEHPLWPKLQERKVKYRALGGGYGPLHKALRAERPTLLHTHGYKAGILGRAAGLATGVPVLSTFHAGEPGTGAVRLYSALDRWSARLAAEIVAVSTPIAQRLPDRTRVIGNFIAVPPESTPTGHKIAFVGRLSKEKGPDLFCQLSKWVAAAELVVFGDGPMRHELQEQYPDIHFAGQQPSMSRIWPEIGLLCMTSRNEGLPLAALEAMAHGIPVAAFKVGGMPDLIVPDQNGWLVDSGDLSGFAGTVASWKALDPAARAKVGKSARQTVIERFSREAIFPQILDTYRSAIA